MVKSEGPSDDWPLTLLFAELNWKPTTLGFSMLVKLH